MIIRNIHIVGSGAVGHYLAYRLQSSNIPYKLLNRQGQAINSDFISYDGSAMALTSSQQNEQQANSSSFLATQADGDEWDIIFLAVKAFDLQSAVLQKLQTLTQPAVFICLCNGAVEFTLHKIAAAHSQHKWRIGLCTVGISRNESQLFQQKSPGGIVRWGPLILPEKASADSSTLVADENSAAPHLTITAAITADEKLLLQRIDHFDYCEDILPHCHKKWLFNMIINTLCAAKRLANNGALLAHRSLVEAVFEESFRLGIELFGPWTVNRQQLLQETVALIEQSRGNENSMAVDVRLGRKTEVDFLSGLAYNAAKYPLLTTLTNEIRDRLANKQPTTTNPNR